MYEEGWLKAGNFAEGKGSGRLNHMNAGHASARQIQRWVFWPERSPVRQKTHICVWHPCWRVSDVHWGMSLKPSGIRGDTSTVFSGHGEPSGAYLWDRESTYCFIRCGGSCCNSFEDTVGPLSKQSWQVRLWRVPCLKSLQMNADKIFIYLSSSHFMAGEMTRSIEQRKLICSWSLLINQRVIFFLQKCSSADFLAIANTCFMILFL